MDMHISRVHCFHTNHPPPQPPKKKNTQPKRRGDKRRREEKKNGHTNKARNKRKNNPREKTPREVKDLKKISGFYIYLSNTSIQFRAETKGWISYIGSLWE